MPQLLRLNRAALYYHVAPVDAYELELMALVDCQYLRTPFYGSRRMTAWLQTQGHAVNRKRVQRMWAWRDMPRPHTSRPTSAHRIYPYLCAGCASSGPSGWTAEITDIRWRRVSLPGRGHGLVEPLRFGFGSVES